MFLGIEIGGTKLQLGVSRGDGGELVELVRHDVDPSRGAQGILDQINQTFRQLIPRYDITSIGYGFGGPVDPKTGCVVCSHQIHGWDGFPLVDWTREKTQLPVVLGNDCDCAALAEARFGAGRGERIVFYITVGTGIGGGLVIDGRLHGAGRPAVAEIGHLRPGLAADRADWTVESMASGWGIASAARALLDGHKPHPLAADDWDDEPIDSNERLDLLSRVAGDPDALTTKLIAEAAADGNRIALAALTQGINTLGWAIAQMMALVAPSVVVIGGGVSLIGERLFFEPLRNQVARYVFPPQEGAYRIIPAQLGEEVVVHGALARAANAESDSPRSHRD